MKKLLIILCLLVFSCNLEEVKREDKIKNVVVIPNKMDNNAFVIKKFLEELEINEKFLERDLNV